MHYFGTCKQIKILEHHTWNLRKLKSLTIKRTRFSELLFKLSEPKCSNELFTFHIGHPACDNNGSGSLSTLVLYQKIASPAIGRTTSSSRGKIVAPPSSGSFK